MRSMRGALSPEPFFENLALASASSTKGAKCSDALARYALYTFSRSDLFLACDLTAM